MPLNCKITYPPVRMVPLHASFRILIPVGVFPHALTNLLDLAQLLHLGPWPNDVYFYLFLFLTFLFSILFPLPLQAPVPCPSPLLGRRRLQRVVAYASAVLSTKPVKQGKSTLPCHDG